MGNELSLCVDVPAEINPTGIKIRVVGTPDNPEFVTADVCKVLGNANPRDVASRLDADEKGVGIVDTPGGPQEVGTLKESGLYHASLTSRAKNARVFRRWVCHEVLPSIRKRGHYGAERYEELIRVLTDKVAELTTKLARLETARPPVIQAMRINEGCVVMVDLLKEWWPESTSKQRQRIMGAAKGVCSRRGILIFRGGENGNYHMDTTDVGILLEQHARVRKDEEAKEKAREAKRAADPQTRLFDHRGTPAYRG